MYTCTHLYTYTHVYTCTHMYTCTKICKFVTLQIHTRAFTRTHTCLRSTQASQKRPPEAQKGEHETQHRFKNTIQYGALECASLRCLVELWVAVLPHLSRPLHRLYTYAVFAPLVCETFFLSFAAVCHGGRKTR